MKQAIKIQSVPPGIDAAIDASDSAATTYISACVHSALRNALSGRACLRSMTIVVHDVDDDTVLYRPSDDAMLYQQPCRNSGAI